MRIAEDIIQSPPLEKEILIEGLFCKGDLITFGGRRKNGKTTLLFDLAFSLASGAKSFLGHKISREGKVIMVLLEDSESNIRGKVESLFTKFNPQGRLGIIDRGDLRKNGVPVIDINDVRFTGYLKEEVRKFEPDLLIIDNLSHLVRGQYNESGLIDKCVVFAQEVGEENGCALIIAAHPRKRDRDDPEHKLPLQPESFFEDLMGSSHLINSADCLWGIEVKNKEERTNHFYGGMQRWTGEEHLSIIQLGEDEFFNLVDDKKERLLFLVNTTKRRQAWKDLGDCSWSTAEAQKRCSGMSRASFYQWWKDLIRNELVLEVEGEEDLWRKS